MKALILLFTLLISIISLSQTPIQAKSIGDGQFTHGKFEEAIKSYNTVLETNKKDVSTLVNRGQCYYSLGQLQAAINDYTAAIKAEKLYHFSYYLRACAYRDLKQYSKALTDFNSAIELEKDPEYYSKRGTIHNLMGNDDLALKDFDFVIKKIPDSIIGYEGKGGVYINKRDYLNALPFYQRVVEIDSTYTFGYLAISDCYWYTDRLSLARENLQKVVSLDPTDWVALNNLGFMLLQEEKYTEAAESFMKLKTEFPDNSLAHNNYGYAIFKTGQIDEGHASMLKALEIDPTNSYIHKNLGLVYIEKGDKKKACKEFKLALKKGFTEMYGSDVLDLQKEHCK